MDVLFLTNRPWPDGILSDGCIPGAISWGTTRCEASNVAAEGWAWTGEAMALSEKDFTKQLGSKLTGKRPKALLIHIHGAGNTTQDAFCRTANLAQLYGRPDLEIVPVLISWACGLFNIPDYLAARSWMIKNSGGLPTAFAALAAQVAKRPSGVPAILLAHSLGNELLSCLLCERARRSDGEPPEADPPFDDVLLLAADVNADALSPTSAADGSGLHRLHRWSRQTHVYFSSADGTVGLSGLGPIFVPIPRRFGPALGSFGPHPNIMQGRHDPRQQVIGCSFVSAAISQPHHYWRLDPLVVEDIRAVIRQAPASTFPWRAWSPVDDCWNLLPPAMGMAAAAIPVPTTGEA